MDATSDAPAIAYPYLLVWRDAWKLRNPTRAAASGHAGDPSGSRAAGSSRRGGPAARRSGGRVAKEGPCRIAIAIRDRDLARRVWDAIETEPTLAVAAV